MVSGSHEGLKAAGAPGGACPEARNGLKLKISRSSLKIMLKIDSYICTLNVLAKRALKNAC